MSFRQMGIASEANLQSTFLVHLTEHLIEEILVRIATPCDLVRASAACASFRRLVAAASFLRRYRSLHPPVLLGVLSPMGFLPAEVPHPNALAAYALARDADFQHQFRQLPPRQQRCWSHCDARDGRVLWKSSHSASGLALPQLAVCDPLTRGYTLLPPIPEGLVASQLLGPALDVHFDCFDAFFVPSGDYEEAHFRVIGWTHCKAMAAVFVYSSLSGAWTAGTSTTWNALGLVVEAEPENALGLVVEAEPDNALGLVVEAEHENALGLVVEAEPENALGLVVEAEPENALGLVVEAEPENALGLVVEAEPEIALGLVEWPSYVYGCFYWHVCRSNMLLKLDINRMEFSAVGLPPVCENQCLVVAAEAGEGRIGILKHIAGQGIPQSLCYSVRQNEGENANGHPVETTIQLPSDYDKYWVVAAAQGYIFLEASRFVYQQGTHRLIGGSSAFFSLEIKTLKIQRVCSTRGALCDHVLPYFGFPSFMSPARI